MKIALVGNTLFSQGAEYVLATLARGFAAKGHAVDVVLSKLQDDYLAQHPDWRPFGLSAGVRVVVCPYRHARHSVFALWRLMWCNRYDVVMSHASPYSLPLVIASWGLLWRRPLLIHVQHSGGTGVNANGTLFGPSRQFWARVETWLLNRFDGLFGVSEGTTEAIHRTRGTDYKKLFTVYNPVIDETFREKLKGRPSHPWLRDPTVPVVVAAGAIVPNKRYDMLVEAFSEVVREVPARLVVFGKGACLTKCLNVVNRHGLQDCVSFPGFTDNLPAEIKNASCFVICSGVESFSVVCVEALAAGVKVVSTNCPYGPPEILKGGEYGVLVDSHDVHALARGIVSVLRGGGVAPNFDMVAPYTVEAIVGRYERAIETLKGRK